MDRPTCTCFFTAPSWSWVVQDRLSSIGVAVHLYCICVCIQVGAARRRPASHEDGVWFRQRGDLALEEVVPDQQAGRGVDTMMRDGVYVCMRMNAGARSVQLE